MIVCGLSNKKNHFGIGLKKELEMELGMDGQVAVITGGSIGIGLAVAKGLAAEGVHLVLCARNDERVVKEAKLISTTFGVNTLGIAADVTNAEDIERLVALTKAEFGGVDILINNAGTGSNEKIMTAPDDKWQYYWDLHVMAAVRLSRGLVPLMRTRGGGVIINNASICAKQPLDYEPIYNVTKAALMMFSKNLSEEVINDGIRVNCINPGLILTPDWIKTAKQLTEGTDRTWEEYLQNIADQNAPIKRFATPEELAHFFVFLCSPRASYCVGSTYYVDGGWLRVV
jgi:NAD(P)-dependent dehydrogenase (short-subunit alcohol dehydrogenase family)